MQTMNGIDSTLYEALEAATDRHGVLDWTLLPGDEEEQGEMYWKARDKEIVDESGDLVTMYRCDECMHYFYPADLSVGDGSGDYCWNDSTGNGCRDAHLPEDER